MPPTFTRYRVTGSGDIRYNYEEELQICSITTTRYSAGNHIVRQIPICILFSNQTSPASHLWRPCVQVETKESLMIGKEWAGHWQEPWNTF